MAITSAGINTVVGDIGGAFADFGSAKASEVEAQGDFTAGADYLRAEDIAKQNEQITQQSTDIQNAQVQRKVLMSNATGQAQVANNNLSGGSAGDILRMGMQQGALASAVVKTQGAINKNAFAEQAAGLQAQSDSAVAAGNAALASAEAKNQAGVFSLIGGAVSMGGMFIGA
jgi:hypothetical protein